MKTPRYTPLSSVILTARLTLTLVVGALAGLYPFGWLMATTTPPPLHTLSSDWINDTLPGNPCSGHYVPATLPRNPHPQIAADSSEFSMKDGATLKGRVTFTQFEQWLSADRVEIKHDLKHKKITHLTAYGFVELNLPNIRVIAPQAQVDTQAQSINIDSPTFHIYSHHARGEAHHAVLIKDKRYTLTHARYTTCAPGNTDWEMQATRIEIDPEKQEGKSYNTWISFKSIPIFYAPYLTFPVDRARKSGWLLPKYAFSNQSGSIVTAPYYFNVAPNMDATVGPQWLTRRNIQLLGEWRYLNRQGPVSIQSEFLADDRRLKQFKAHWLANPPQGMLPTDPRYLALQKAKPNRYALALTDNRRWSAWSPATQGAQDGLSSRIQFTTLSDTQYLSDLPTDHLNLSPHTDHLDQSLDIAYLTQRSTVEALFQDYQTLHTILGPEIIEPYRIVPKIDLDHMGFQTSFWHTSVSGQLAQFISPDHPTIDQYSQGQRYFVKPKVGLDLKTSSAYFKPEVAWHTRQYTLSRLSAPLQSTGAHKQQTVGIPIHTLDMGLFLERQLGSQSIQTLEPRLFYLYVPNINQNNLPTFDSTLYSFNYQQLFRDNRFSGLDRQSDAHQLAFGTTSRLKHKDSGREYAQINIGQLYYFTSAHVSLCDPNSTPGCRTIENPFADAKASSVVTELLAHINPALSVRAEGQFNPSLHRIAAVTTSLQYHHPHLPQKLFNIEYNFLKEGNIQYDLEGNRLYPVNDPHNDLSTLVSSFKLPLALHWTGIAYWNFALKGQLTQEVFSGVEYNQCCFALRMGFHRQLRLRNNSMSPKNYDNIASIQFALKGLGQLGTDPGMRLKENIHGFRETLSVF